jgi:excisionase family DNA binding protein
MSEAERIAVGVSEAARLSGLSRRGLENYIRSKVLPSKKVGRRRLVLVEDLRRFLRGDRPSAKSAGVQ